MDRENFRDDLTFTEDFSSVQLKSSLKIISMYVFVLVLWLVVARLYVNFGSVWIIPSVSAMWVMGAVTTFLVREQQEETIKQTKWGILGYLGFLFMYRIVIQLVSPISSEQMGVALNITVPAASGMAAAGLLQNILLIVSVMTPIGFMIWCAQKFKIYLGGSTKQEAFNRIKGIRENKKRI